MDDGAWGSGGGGVVKKNDTLSKKNFLNFSSNFTKTIIFKS